MAKAYMARHQKAGIITSHVFLNKPTDEQLKPIKDECKRLHGEGWMIIHEAELLDEGAPLFPKRESADGAKRVSEFTVKGEGTVTPRE